MLKEFVHKFENFVRNASNIVIVGHFNPDGDSVGSVTGMRYYLEMLGKDPVVLLPSSYPDYLAFIDKICILCHTKLETHQQKCCNEENKVLFHTSKF